MEPPDPTAGKPSLTAKAREGARRRSSSNGVYHRVRRSAHRGLSLRCVARPPFCEQLLLRDVLYLLQGIDGRFIRFAVTPPKEQNPYRSDKAAAADGTAFPLGKDGAVHSQGEEGEVVGIVIDIDEAQVSSRTYTCVRIIDQRQNGHVSKPVRLLLMQIAEMGMLYRQITKFLEVAQAGASSRGMIEQVGGGLPCTRLQLMRHRASVISFTTSCPTITASWPFSRRR